MNASMSKREDHRNQRLSSSGGSFEIPALTRQRTDTATRARSRRLIPKLLAFVACAWALCVPVMVQAQGQARLQFVTRGDDGSMVPQEFTYNSVPCPKIEATVDDFYVREDGTVSVAISGVVTDQASDLVPDPKQQLQSIDVSLEDQVLKTLDLTNTAEPEPPWKPYKFRAPFFTRADFQMNALGSVRLNLVTPQNVAGCASTATFYVSNIVPYETDITPQADSAPGTFLPTILRMYRPEGSPPPPGTHIFAFGQYWDIEEKNFGDGDYWYAVDGNGEPVVFLPAAYAEPYLQTQKLDEIFGAAVVYSVAAVGPVANIPVETGLLVLNDDITMPADKNLLKTIENYKKDELSQNGTTIFAYHPKKGQTLEDLGHSDNTVETEIKWRYVGTKDTIMFFRGKQALVTDIAYRNAVVEAARSADFKFGGELVFNRVFWTGADVVKKGTSPFNAVADVFNAKSKDEYQMACLHGAAYSVLRGASQALGEKQFNESVEDNPFKNRSRIIEETYVPNLTKGNVDNDNPNNANWLPGDWGYITNADSKTNMRKPWELHVGENIIYLGGQNPGDGDFTIKLKCQNAGDKCFLQDAYFWGNISKKEPRIKSLQGWVDRVKQYSLKDAGKPVIESQRSRLRQPQATGSSVFTNATLAPNQFAGGTLTIPGSLIPIRYKIIANTESVLFTGAPVSIDFLLSGDKDKKVDLHEFSFFSLSQDTDTSLLGTLDFIPTNNQLQTGYSLWIQKAAYEVQSNSDSMIILKKKIGIAFEITDDKGGNAQKGNIVKLTASN